MLDNILLLFDLDGNNEWGVINLKYGQTKTPTGVPGIVI